MNSNYRVDVIKHYEEDRIGEVLFPSSGGYGISRAKDVARVIIPEIRDATISCDESYCDDYQKDGIITILSNCLATTVLCAAFLENSVVVSAKPEDSYEDRAKNFLDSNPLRKVYLVLSGWNNRTVTQLYRDLKSFPDRKDAPVVIIDSSPFDDNVCNNIPHSAKVRKFSKVIYRVYKEE